MLCLSASRVCANTDILGGRWADGHVVETIRPIPALLMLFYDIVSIINYKNGANKTRISMRPSAI